MHGLGLYSQGRIELMWMLTAFVRKCLPSPERESQAGLSEKDWHLLWVGNTQFPMGEAGEEQCEGQNGQNECEQRGTRWDGTQDREGSHNSGDNGPDPDNLVQQWTPQLCSVCRFIHNVISFRDTDGKLHWDPQKDKLYYTSSKKYLFTNWSLRCITDFHVTSISKTCVSAWLPTQCLAIPKITISTW